MRPSITITTYIYVSLHFVSITISIQSVSTYHLQPIPNIIFSQYPNMNIILFIVFILNHLVNSKPILDQGLNQPCTSGGKVLFGIPWPKSTKPLARLEVLVDGSPRNIELATSTKVTNIVTAQSKTAQSSGTRTSSCTTTTADTLPWFRLDLGATEDVHSIQITNKGSCCDADVTNLRVYVNDVEGPASDPLSVTTSQESFAFDERTMCGSVPISRIVKDGSKSVECGRRGRYIAITGSANSILKLCDIKGRSNLFC